MCFLFKTDDSTVMSCGYKARWKSEQIIIVNFVMGIDGRTMLA